MAGSSLKNQFREKMVDLGFDNHSKILAANFTDLPYKSKNCKVKGKPEEDENCFASESRKPRSKKAEIVCSDQASFHVGKLYALESCVVENHMTYGFVSPIRVDFTSPIISVVLDFCKRHAEIRNTDDDDEDAHEKLRNFDSEFMKENQSILIDLLRVSLSLQIKSLLHLTSEAVVDMINGKTAEEIHKLLNMEKDLNPEDIEMLLELDNWCFYE